MDNPGPILDYAIPERPTRWLERLRPHHLLWASFIVSIVTVIIPLDIGSGRVIVNPLRILGCSVAVLCVVIYTLTRLAQEHSQGYLRSFFFSVCLLAAAGAFAYAHWSVWGNNHKPRFGLHQDYWRALRLSGVSVLAAVTFELVRWSIQIVAAKWAAR